MKPRAHIAAPWWDPSPGVREWNTRRAELLCRLAAAEGFEPVCVHRALMDAGVDDGADPEARERGLEATCATIREVKAEGGALYGLRCDDSAWTPGTHREVLAWSLAMHGPSMCLSRTGTWMQLCERMARAGLLAEWAALRVRPC